MKNFKIAVLAGDGIGPELMREAIKVLDAVAKIAANSEGFHFEYKEALVGGAAIDAKGEALPADTVELCRESDAILFGSVGGPKWESLPAERQPERAALLPLRKTFDLFANVRPAMVYPELYAISPLKPEIFEGKALDILIIRELTSGIYFGQPKGRQDDYAFDTMKYHVHEIKRIAKLAFETARKRQGKLCSVDKANVLHSMVLWREVITKMAADYPDVELRHLYVDNAAMQLILNPRQFDVILAPNMFGDILSDEASMLSGSLGMLGSASLNASGFGLYEPAGGTAPDIAGQNKANPIAQILSAAMMLEYSFHLKESAESIRKAISKVLRQGLRTLDLQGSADAHSSAITIVSSSEMGDAIAAAL